MTKKNNSVFEKNFCISEIKFVFLKTNPQISEGFRFFLPVQLSKIKKYIFSLIFQ